MFYIIFLVILKIKKRKKNVNLFCGFQKKLLHLGIEIKVIRF